uniref:Uncharacterized protein n=1 Tax=Glossina brevipalpis TaxID=37001 RepID=A0A1A9W7Y2_9MUSC
MVGRKAGKGYELYDFIPSVIKGKHVAICKYCDRELQNTAEARMITHRNSCLATPETKKIQEFSIMNTQNDSTSKGEVPFAEHEKTKTFKYAEKQKERRTIPNELPSTSSSKAVINGKSNENIKAKLEYFKQKMNYLNREMDNTVIEKNLMISQIKKLNYEIIELEVNREHARNSSPSRITGKII